MNKISSLLKESKGAERDILESLPYVGQIFSIKTLKHVSGVKEKNIAGIMKKLILMGYVVEHAGSKYAIDVDFRNELNSYLEENND